jgi:hypothetical protein
MLETDGHHSMKTYLGAARALDSIRTEEDKRKEGFSKGNAIANLLDTELAGSFTQILEIKNEVDKFSES